MEGTHIPCDKFSVDYLSFPPLGVSRLDPDRVSNDNPSLPRTVKKEMDE